MNFDEVKELGSKYLFPNYNRADLAFTKGEGMYLYDTEGNRYLDMVGGIAVNALGYSHPKWVARMQEQVGKLVHVSNLYNVEEQAVLAQKIATLTPGNLDHTMFVNSGAEANECAMKVAIRNRPDCTKILSALNGFHGRTSAALGATGQKIYRDSFEPLISDAFRYYEYGNEESLKFSVDRLTAAVIIEPIQGEAGVISAPESFYKLVRDLCNDVGALMIVDEVQTGMGRTGKWFGIENYKVIPDIITMAKGLGGGMPIGACVSTEEISKAMTPGTHGTTFGGNPLVCASGSAVIDIMKEENILANVNNVGNYLMEQLRSIESEKIVEVRGSGLIIGVEIDSEDNAKNIQKFMRLNGILINICHGKIIRLIPPLIITKAEADMFLEVLRTVL